MAGGALKIQQEAATLGISVQEVMDQHRDRAGAAASLANRGKRNSKMGKQPRNEAVRVLGAQVGAAVMGQERWERYTHTSCRKMKELLKPLASPANALAERERPSGQRDGWEFVPVDVPNVRWSMTDTITYRLPGHTEANPDVYTETLQAAISEAYHTEWYRYSRLERLDEKDKAAGKQLARDTSGYNKRT